MGARISFDNGFVATMKNVLWLEERGFNRDQIAKTIGFSKTRIIAALRIYKASLGATADSAKIEIRNKAIELVKLLEAKEISLTSAEDAFVAELRAQGLKPVPTTSTSQLNPHQQLNSYLRAVGSLEGICYALDKMPDFVHAGISKEQREEIETRLAGCRRIIERRINIIRKGSDNNGDA